MARLNKPRAHRAAPVVAPPVPPMVDLNATLDPVAGIVTPPVVDPIAAIEPAIDAAATRAAIERVADPLNGAATRAPGRLGAPEIVPSIDPVAIDATVLPEPTLVAEPGLPQPLVTASPPLAAEPSAMDVVKAEVAEVERELGIPPVDPTADRAAPHFAAAGQPMLTIQPASAATVAAEAVDAPSISGAEFVGFAQDRPFAFVKVVTVVGPARGRWRAGLAFGPAPRRFLASNLSPRQLDALLGDPQLAVGISEVDERDLLDAELDAPGFFTGA